MPNVKLIALDLDGTLLNSDKVLTRENGDALSRAAEAGIEIVPATGRFYAGMPDFIRELPFVRYAITINGAQVLDSVTGESVYRAEIPLADAVAMMEYLDRLPVIYDCYMDGWGWMTASLQAKAAEYAPTPHNLKMLIELRRAVPELKAHLRATGRDVQKVQAFFHDLDLRARTIDELGRMFPDTAITTSITNNMEINSRDAQKGKALVALARKLGIDPAETVAFGDDMNDLSMIEDAGVGVAMGNAAPGLKRAADRVTLTCDENGVAAEIARILEDNR